MQALPLAGLGLVILFLSLIVVKKNKQRSDIFLALFFVFVGAELIYRYLRDSGFTGSFPWLVLADLAYWILLGPVLYLYAGFIIRKNMGFRWSMLIHLLPLIIVLIPFINYLIADPGTGFFSYADNHPVYRWIIDVFWEYCVLVYLMVIIIRLIGLRQQVLGFFSSRKLKDLNWLLYLSAGFAAFIVISMTLYYLNLLQVFIEPFSLLTWSSLILTLFLLGIGLFSYRQKGIFTEYELQEISNIQFTGKISPDPERKFKYRKSGLQEEESQILLSELKRVMKMQKPYIDCELNLQGLASSLNTSVHKLSQVINEHFGQNFFDFINSYRVEEVKKLLQDSKFNNLKVISLAYDCGFNSKSAFYTAFKKDTGMTPLDYRKKYQPEHTKIFAN